VRPEGAKTVCLDTQNRRKLDTQKPAATPGSPKLLRWTPVEFLKRLSSILAPPRLNLVRYAGALGPRSKLRRYLLSAAQEQISFDLLLAGVSIQPAPLLRCLRRLSRKASNAARSWAMCLARIFEAYPLLCPRCGIEMDPVACITEDRELSRILAHLGLPAEFPITKPARAPPPPFDPDHCQIDPDVDRWDGIDPQNPGDRAAA